MRRFGVEEQRVAGLQQVAAVGVAIADLAGKHVEELDPGVAKPGVRHGVPLECDQVGLDPDLARERMPEQIVEVAGFGAAALDANPLVDIRNTRKIWRVMQYGRLVDRDAILSHKRHK